MTLKQIITVLPLFFMLPFFSSGQDLADPMADENLVFEETDGLVAVEAEYFFKQSKNGQRKWYRTSAKEWPDVGLDSDSPHPKGAENNAYLEILPDTRSTHDDELIHGENFSNLAGEMALLHYKVKINNPGRYYVWVRAFSTGSEDNGLHVGMDGSWPETGQRLQWCDGKNTWRWESKQRTAEEHCGVPHLIYLDIEDAGIHEIMFSMREDGFEFDRFLLTNEKEFVPEGVGPEVAVSVSTLPEAFPVAESNPGEPEITGELKKWHKVTFTFKGPFTSETDGFNPFMNYRLNVVLTHKNSGKSYTVPGYFAADGNAGETSSTEGDKWRVHFAPSKIGTWEYVVDFRKGSFSAVSEKEDTGESGGFMDGARGTFEIFETDKAGRDMRSKGMLQYVGERYLKFTETGQYFLKAGADAPENFLAYADFDGTFHNDGRKDDLVKTWEPHLKDWREGDPTWKDGKGKAIVGAVNYLASKGMNVFSFLTLSTEGDDQNVFPHINYETLDRYDCSKLDQWEKVFEHADQMGMFLHFKLTEAENQGLFDNGAIGALYKLYYRELIARFGHHLALNWNIGEENGEWVTNHHTPPMNTAQRRAAAAYISYTDPYDHHIVIHNGRSYHDLLGPEVEITGPSVQTHKPDFSLVHGEVLKWIKLSQEAGKQWAVAVDEPGDAQHALLTDEENPEHNNARKNGLWGTFMAGGWGTEWYFGYRHPNSDLTCQDYSSRDLFWDQCRHALDFFNENNIPFWLTENHDELVAEDDYCLAIPGHLYIVYLKNGKGSINLENTTGNYSIKWYDPRNGGSLQSGTTEILEGGKIIKLKDAPSNPEKDWVVLIQK